MSQPRPAAPEVERTEELRLALVLNGGVSLAVWMGGVAFELNRLVRETHPVYRGLLELTRTAARIDVISGTSAGGINGAALALAQIHDRSLYSLRDVWLNTAGLEDLMRQPDDENPSSLLRGDTWFLPRIQAAFAELAQGKPAPKTTVPILLSLTSTLLDGFGHRRLDDFGAVVEDTVHRALWRFERMDGQDDAFEDKRIVAQLAFAARATASFPVAFEPARYEPDGELFKSAPALNYRVSHDQPVAETSFLLDGGILDNKPFEAALQGIAKLPAQGNTRRVLAYIVPDPAAAAAKRPLDEQKQPIEPTLAQAAWRSLVSIPGSQSIASHMADLREHNDGAMHRWRRIVGAVQHAGAAPLLASAAAMLPAYRARRVDGIIDYLLNEIENRLASDHSDGDKANVGMRRATRQWLASTWRASSEAHPLLWVANPLSAVDQLKHQQLAPLWAARLPTGYDPRQRLLGPGQWQWGLYTLEFVADLTVELLRRTQRLNAMVERWGQGENSVVEGPWPRDTALAAGGDWKDLDLQPSAARRLTRLGRPRLGDALLGPFWQQVYALAAEVRQRRRDADRLSGKLGAAGFLDLIKKWREQGGERPERGLALDLIHQLLGNKPEDQAANDADARRLFTVLARLRKPIARIMAAQAARARSSGRADVEEAVLEMGALQAFLFGDLPHGPGLHKVDAIAWRVLALEVFEVTAASRRHGPNAPAEVVQISARLASSLGVSDDPSGQLDNPSFKLNGMQLAHFGAFYKRSWRANDWTFGCLDGIDRAVRIALNADALQRRYGMRHVDSGDGMPVPAAAYVKAYIRRLAVDSAEEDLRSFLNTLWEADDADITTELQWLDQASTVPPPVLERCATALTRRLQLEALRRELPEIARSLIIERNSGAPPANAASASLLARIAPGDQPRVPSADEARTVVLAGLLGRETLPMQIGTDLFTRTVTQGLATAHASLSSKHGGFNALNVLFKLTEWPLLILYWLGNRLSQAGNTGVALEAAALGAGGALVAASMLSEKLNGSALALGWALLAGVLGATLLRSRKLGALLLLGLLVGAGWLDHLLLWELLAACAGVLLLLSKRGGLLAMTGIVLGAAWWSAGGSTDALALLWQQLNPWATAPTAAPNADHVAALKQLKQALWPALLVVALVGLNALARRLGKRGAGRQP